MKKIEKDMKILNSNIEIIREIIEKKFGKDISELYKEVKEREDKNGRTKPKPIEE